MKKNLAAVIEESEARRKAAATIKTEVLPLVEGLVILIEGELQTAGKRRHKELTRYVQPIRAIQYILHKTLDD